ncbi:MAG: ion transporter [Cyanobacteriota bacterium]|nr:ion transporter [Cyanobacteriota bacterium]
MLSLPSRETILFYIEDVETPIGRAINLTIMGLILLSSSLFVAETYPIPDAIALQIDTIQRFLFGAFAFEYLVRFWCAKSKLQFIFSFFSIVDFIAIFPFLFGILDLGYIRILRWFQILRLIRFFTFKIYIFHIDNEDSIIFIRILFTLLTIIFIFSGLIYQVEHGVNSEFFRTFLDAVYFSVVTMTTVGFGDIVPASQMGRLLTILMIFTGIALIPWQVGDLITHLIQTANKNKNKDEKACSGCGCLYHDRDAKFCKICGTKLEVD